MGTPVPEPVQRVLAALRAHGMTAKPIGTGWQCRCPAHDDRTPSLSIGAGDDGRALVKCHAGCATEDVLGSIGLALRDLMTGGELPVRPPTRQAKARDRGGAVRQRGPGHPTADAAMARTSTWASSMSTTSPTNNCWPP